MVVEVPDDVPLLMMMMPLSDVQAPEGEPGPAFYQTKLQLGKSWFLRFVSLVLEKEELEEPSEAWVRL